MAVFFVEVNVEVELEGLGGSGGLERVAHGHRLVQGVERGVEGSVVLHVGLGDARCNRLEGREDGQLLAVGVPLEDLVEEPEAFDRGLQARLAPYDLYEATLLAGLNQHLSCLMDALGLGRPSAALTASALSHVCGLTLRDWGDTSW